jgi:hypothetical protein
MKGVERRNHSAKANTSPRQGTGLNELGRQHLKVPALGIEFKKGEIVGFRRIEENEK